MSYLDVYVGDLDDPEFEWVCSDEKWNVGNCPKSLTPLFPMGHEAFSRLVHLIENNKLEGKQVDWGGWVAKATKLQILAFIDEIYNDTWRDNHKSFPHLIKQLEELKKAVNQLEDNKLYALTASEL